MIYPDCGECKDSQPDPITMLKVAEQQAKGK